MRLFILIFQPSNRFSHCWVVAAVVVGVPSSHQHHLFVRSSSELSPHNHARLAAAYHHFLKLMVSPLGSHFFWSASNASTCAGQFSGGVGKTTSIARQKMAPSRMAAQMKSNEWI